MATACAAPSAVVRQQPVAHRPVSAPGAPAAAFVSQGAYKYKGRVWVAARGGLRNQGAKITHAALLPLAGQRPGRHAGRTAAAAQQQRQQQRSSRRLTTAAAATLEGEAAAGLWHILAAACHCNAVVQAAA